MTNNSQTIRYNRTNSGNNQEYVSYDNGNTIINCAEDATDEVYIDNKATFSKRLQLTDNDLSFYQNGVGDMILVHQTSTDMPQIITDSTFASNSFIDSLESILNGDVIEFKMAPALKRDLLDIANRYGFNVLKELSSQFSFLTPEQQADLILTTISGQNLSSSTIGDFTQTLNNLGWKDSEHSRDEYEISKEFSPINIKIIGESPDESRNISLTPLLAYEKDFDNQPLWSIGLIPDDDFATDFISFDKTWPDASSNLATTISFIPKYFTEGLIEQHYGKFIANPEIEHTSQNYQPIKSFKDLTLDIYNSVNNNHLKPLEDTDQTIEDGLDK